MRGFLRWFKSTAKVKRWILLGIVGIALVCFGISKILISKTLNTKEIVEVVLAFVIGLSSIVISMIFMQKRMLEILVEESDTRKEKSNVIQTVFGCVQLFEFINSNNKFYRDEKNPYCMSDGLQHLCSSGADLKNG